jgi:hypothetical protein
MSELKNFVVGLLVVTLFPFIGIAVIALFLAVGVYSIGKWCRGDR